MWGGKSDTGSAASIDADAEADANVDSDADADEDTRYCISECSAPDGCEDCCTDKWCYANFRKLRKKTEPSDSGETGPGEGGGVPDPTEG